MEDDGWHALQHSEEEQRNLPGNDKKVEQLAENAENKVLRCFVRDKSEANFDSW